MHRGLANTGLSAAVIAQIGAGGDLLWRERHQSVPVTMEACRQPDAKRLLMLPVAGQV